MPHFSQGWVSPVLANILRYNQLGKYNKAAKSIFAPFYDKDTNRMFSSCSRNFWGILTSPNNGASGFKALETWESSFMPPCAMISYGRWHWRWLNEHQLTSFLENRTGWKWEAVRLRKTLRPISLLNSWKEHFHLDKFVCNFKICKDLVSKLLMKRNINHKSPHLVELWDNLPFF